MIVIYAKFYLSDNQHDNEKNDKCL